MAIARNATNTLGTVSAGAVTTISRSWAATTTAGSTLILAVSWNPNSTNGTSVSVQPGWVLRVSATRQVSSVDTMKCAIYTKANAAAQSGAVTVTLSSASYATLHLVEVTGAATVSLDQVATDNLSSLAADCGTTPTTSQNNEYLFALIANANSATTQSAPTNSFAQVDQQTSAGGGTDHINAAIYDRNVTATGAYTTTVTLSGAILRSWVGAIVTLKEASSGATIQGSFGTGTGGTTFRSWTGMSARSSSADVTTGASGTGAYANIFHLRSCYKLWKDFEPSLGNYNWAGLAASIQGAADSQSGPHPWRLIFRIEMGYAAPSWLFTTTSNPVNTWYFVDAANNTSPGASPNNNHVAAFLTGGGAFDSNYQAHVVRMLQAINTYLGQPDGHGGKLGDWVYFMAISAPTVQPGTEMTTQPGPGTPLPGGFVYDGPPANRTGATTYRALNSNVWNTIQSNVTTRATWLKNAWVTSIDLHMQHLTNCRSSVACGSIFNDNWGGAHSIATTQGAQYGDNLVFMSTDLQTDTTPYPNGTYDGWSHAAAQTFVNAIAVGAPVGFQTAGDQILTNEAKFWAAFQSGLGDFNMAFFECSPSAAARFVNSTGSGTGYPGEAGAQALLVPDSGTNAGQISGQASFSLTGTLVQQAYLFVNDTFQRTSVNSWGSSDNGSPYTLTGTAGDFGVASGVGTIVVSAANQTKIAAATSVIMDDTDGRVLWQLDKLPIGQASGLRYYLRQQDASNYYALGVSILTNGNIQVDSRKLVGGVATVIGNTTPNVVTTFTAGGSYWLRAAASGSNPTTLHIKVWPADGSLEPDWQYSAQDSEAVLQDTGSVAIACLSLASTSNTPLTFTFDQLQVFPDSPTLQMDGTSSLTLSNDTQAQNIPVGLGKVRTPRS